jgi:hypothetical protein
MKIRVVRGNKADAARNAAMRNPNTCDADYLSWVFEVENFLRDENELSREAQKFIGGIKLQGEAFNWCENLVALLRQLYKRKYDRVTLPPIKKHNQIFVAMMFSSDTDSIYENVYKPVVASLGYLPLRIDEKQFNGSIIGEITTEIKDSLALVADLTGNLVGHQTLQPEKAGR